MFSGSKWFLHRSQVAINIRTDWVFVTHKKCKCATQRNNSFFLIRDSAPYSRTIWGGIKKRDAISISSFCLFETSIAHIMTFGRTRLSRSLTWTSLLSENATLISPKRLRAFIDVDISWGLFASSKHGLIIIAFKPPQRTQTRQGSCRVLIAKNFTLGTLQNS